MAVLPYCTGLSPKRWGEAVDILIMKTAQDHWVNRTRPIPLLEADSNNNAKLLSTLVSQYAECKGLFANEQYGSRLNRSSIHLATNKKLIYDISRQMKYPIAVCSNDARSCYDRIVHSAGFLALRRLGAPKNAITSMFRSIQHMKHRVRTSFGDSEGLLWRRALENTTTWNDKR